MADIKAHHGTADHAPSPLPVEGDGINYRGLVWFAVILTATTLFCQVLVWGMFKWWENREEGRDVARAPVAAPASHPTITGGRLDGGSIAPQPALLVNEPTVLRDFREHERQSLEEYGWVDRNAGTMRIPISRAKELLLQRGLPVRGATTPAPPATKGKE